MPQTLTRMQAIARDFADVPRAVLARHLGIKPAAVTKRLQRAKRREARLGVIDPSSIRQPRLDDRRGRRLEYVARFATN